MSASATRPPSSAQERRRKKAVALLEEKRPDGSLPGNFRGTAGRLLRLLLPYKLLLAVALVSSVIATLLSTVGPMLLGNVIDAIQTQVQAKLSGSAMDFGTIARILLTILSIYVVSSAFLYIQGYTMAGVTQDVVRDMRGQVNAKLSRLPLRYFDTHTKGDILSRIMNDIDNISNTLQNNLTQILSSVVTMIGVFVMMFVVSWKMALIALCILPVCALVALLVARHSKRYFRQQWDRMGELNGHIEEMYTGHKIVKVFGHEQTAIDDFDDVNDELFRVSRKAQFISGMISPLLNFLNNIGYVLICIVGGVFILQRSASIGNITSFITYLKLLTQPVADLGNIMNNLQSSLASAERVFTLLDAEEEPPDQSHTRLDRPTGRVVIEHVDFSYSTDKPLITDLNLTVEPGQLIAIVGPTGAGKTTIVNLLMRFYDVDAGRILVDETDIRTLPRENLRRIFGMVLQDTWLFEGTVRDNIAYGRDGATLEEIEAAARAAYADPFIRSLNGGYDGRLEEDGLNLSQGQRQLLTIARAFLADPVILILDEATSSVDTRTELLIQRAMKTLMQGRTSFVIAHRLSTIREADVILVMRHGHIIEQGTHEELLRQDSFYAELYHSQFADCGLEEED